MKQVLLFITLLTLGLLVSCHKSEPEEQCPDGLPCATQEGTNTFGCYIDGKPWVAYVAPYILDPSARKIDANYDESGFGHDYYNQLNITASHYDSTSNGFMALHIRPISTTGIITPSKFTAQANIGYLNPPKISWAFQMDTFIEYKMNITRFDVSNNIISGEFSFKGVNGNDTIRVTDGRFDVKYNPE